MKNFLENELPKMYKAVAAFVSLLIPLVTTIVTALSDGRITTSEWVAIVAAASALPIGTGAVYQVTNKVD